MTGIHLPSSSIHAERRCMLAGGGVRCSLCLVTAQAALSACAADARQCAPIVACQLRTGSQVDCVFW